MRRPPNYADELAAAQKRIDELKHEAATRLGELVVATGARDLPPDILAGGLLDLVARYRDQPANLAAFAESGAAFFRRSSGRRRANGGPAADAAAVGTGGAAPDSGARPA